MSQRSWRVVGGEDKGGIVVRTGRELNSAREEQRLSTGAIVREEEFVNGRLRFVRESGSGPDGGWVSISLGEKPLLVPAGEEPVGKGLGTGTRVPSFRLLDGHSMPALGLGVYRCSPGDETYNSVKWALELGYRMVDTAAMYRNEESVGKAIRDSGIPRSEIFVTTKLPPHGHGYDDAISMFNESLDLLGLDYVDLYLIHAPSGGKLIETWDALLEVKRQGLVRSVGVSNYGRKHIEALRAHGRPLPTVNQLEMHPLVYEERKNLVDYCVEKKILVQAYGSVFSGQQHQMQSKAVKKVLAGHPGKTPAQVLLRWGLQMGFQVIPKSVRRERLAENFNVFDFQLSPGELAVLNGMSGSLGEYWFPMNAPVDLGRTDRWHKQ